MKNVDMMQSWTFEEEKSTLGLLFYIFILRSLHTSTLTVTELLQPIGTKQPF